MTDTGMVRAPAPIRPARAARAGCRRPAVAATLAALLLVLAPAAARASGGLVVMDCGFPSIVVIGNGYRYTGVSALGYAWKVAVDIDTGTLGRIKEWHIWPILTVEGQPPLELKVSRVSHVVSIRVGPVAATEVSQEARRAPVPGRPDQGLRRLGVQPGGRSASDAGPGTTRRSFPSRIRSPRRRTPSGSWTSPSAGTRSAKRSSRFAADIVCAKWAWDRDSHHRRLRDIAVPMEVKQSGLVVFPAEHAGACPVQLSLFGRVDGQRLRHVRELARVHGGLEVHQDGSHGARARRMASTRSSSSTRSRSRSCGRDARPGGGPAGGQVSGGGALPDPQRPADPVSPPNTPPVGSPVGITTGTPPNVHQAALRLVARGGGKTVASSWHDYKVACDPKVATGLGRLSMRLRRTSA